MTQSVQVVGASALTSFRQQNNATEILKLVRGARHVLINWPVGVGKSHNMDNVIKAAASVGYDLVIALMPTRAIIDERELILHPTSSASVINIKPRPQSMCGSLNERWQQLESQGLSPVARSQLCRICTHSKTCNWLTQYSAASLKGAQVIFATQAHLKINQNFITNMVAQTGATQPLIVFDEATISLTSFTQTIPASQLDMFRNAIRALPVPQHNSSALLNWLEALQQARTQDLQKAADWCTPTINSATLLTILEKGIELYPKTFHNLYPQLKALCSSPASSRQKDTDQNISFSSPPVLAPFDVLLYSATVESAVLNHRLQLSFSSPYAAYSFSGEQTHWFNIASSTAANCNFGGNKPQILDFFVQLLTKRYQEGKRVLLIAKKSRKAECIKEMNTLLSQLGNDHLQVVDGEHYEGARGQIPLIHYGVIGINKFEHFDCAFCLTSYYVPPEVVAAAIQDIYAKQNHIPIHIRLEKQPRRRVAEVEHIYRFTDVAELANPMLRALETGTVIQTVGRVRPFTHNREIITYQNGDIPGINYSAEFDNLTQAREYFGIETKLQRRLDTTYMGVQQLKQQGLKQKEIALQLDISVRTVRRHYKSHQ